MKNSNEVDVKSGCGFLIEELEAWKDDLALPAPGSLKIAPARLDEAARLSGNKNNPVQLEEAKKEESCCAFRFDDFKYSRLKLVHA